MTGRPPLASAPGGGPAALPGQGSGGAGAAAESRPVSVKSPLGAFLVERWQQAGDAMAATSSAAASRAA